MKKEILRLLRQSEGYVSGQELCNRFGVSRTAVWKVINQLKEAGYEIESTRAGSYLDSRELEDAELRMLIDGVLSSSECFTEESHFSGLLEYPQYTRPEEWHGKKVPEILLSGHHANIEKWRQEQSLIRTKGTNTIAPIKVLIPLKVKASIDSMPTLWATKDEPHTKAVSNNIITPLNCVLFVAMVFSCKIYS